MSLSRGQRHGMAAGSARDPLVGQGLVVPPATPNSILVRVAVDPADLDLVVPGAG